MWTRSGAVIEREATGAGSNEPAWRRSLRAACLILPYAAAVVLLALSLARGFDPATGFTSFIRFGQSFADRAMPQLARVPHAIAPGSGYDGQFYAQLALDPFLRSEEIGTALDSPRYRGRRILLPWIASAVGLEDPARAVHAYSVLNIVCWPILGGLLLIWLPPGSARSAAAWFACLFSHGLMSSMAMALPDGPALLLIALGVRAIERGRATLSAVIMGVAGLARETSLLAVAMLLPDRVRAPVEWRRGDARVVALACRTAVAVAPIAFWAIYLWTLDLSGTYIGRRNFSLPFWGYVVREATILDELARYGWSSAARVSLLSLVAVTTQATVMFWSGRWELAWWRVGAAYGALMLVLGAAVWEGAPGASTRVLLPLTVAFNIVVLKHRWFWPLWMLGNANLLHGLETIGATEVVPILGFLQSFI